MIILLKIKREKYLKKGYVKFRVATFNGEAPNFTDPKLINL